MITPAYAQRMAAYNQWQNTSIFAGADTLDDANRTLHRGAHFGSIFNTLNHLLWADRIWLSRFAGTPAPNQANIPSSVQETDTWADLKSARPLMDQTIIDWAKAISAQSLAGNLRWFSGAVGHEVEKPLALLIIHFFNHQTHHRGQVHAMLTAAGAKPGPTDLSFQPDP